MKHQIPAILQPRYGPYLLALFLGVFLPARLLQAQPLIMDQPDPQPVFTGAQITFSVTAETLVGSDLTFQWRRNGVDIPGARHTVPGPVATDEYQIFGVQPSDCGLYSVVVSDINGATNSDLVSLLVTNIVILPVADNFATRGDLGSTTGGQGRFTNLSASNEPGEPNHGGKRGGTSVWLKWTAQVTGIATFRTLGSGLDTTLGVYTGKDIPSLVLAADDDDDAGFLNSQVRFNTIAGTEYNIAIDGYYGAKGDLILGWQVVPSTELLPTIVTHPVGRTVALGTNVTFNVLGGAGLPVNYQWFLNGSELPGETSPFLNISTVEPLHLGTYRVRLQNVFNQTLEVFSRGATLQVNTVPGGVNNKAAAMRKFQEAADPTQGPDTPARPADGGNGPIRLASGFTGTQLFNTYGSTKEPGEPNHCGEAGGASFWFSYLAPAGGTLSVDTTGTAFNSVLAVYTGPGDSFATLEPVTCSNTNPITGAEVVSFVVTNGQTNYIVVDGVAGASGLVAINYNLISPPVIVTNPQSRTVTLNNNVTLTVTAGGAPALGYRWRSNSVFIPNRTNTSLTITNFKANYQAGYDVVVTNGYGGATSSVATLYLDAPLRFTTLVHGPGAKFSTRLLGRANTNYVLQFATNLPASGWVSQATNFTSTGILDYTNATTSSTNRYFRAKYQ